MYEKNKTNQTKKNKKHTFTKYRWKLFFSILSDYYKTVSVYLSQGND